MAKHCEIKTLDIECSAEAEFLVDEKPNGGIVYLVQHPLFSVPYKNMIYT
jgi:hypothetical protein